MITRYGKLYARVSRKPRRRESSRAAGRFGAALAAVLGYGLLVCLANVYLRRQTTRVGMQWEGRRRQLNTLTQESENLYVERESYLRGDYIRKRAAKLGLVAPAPGQVRLVRLGTLESELMASSEH